MADTPDGTKLYRMVTNVSACEEHGAHDLGDRLHLSPDNILVRAGCAHLVTEDAAAEPDAPKAKTAKPKP